MNLTTLKSVLAALGVLLSLNAMAYDVEIDGIYYNVVKKSKQAGEAGVTSGSNKYTGEVTIPNSIVYEGVTYPVTSIGYSAFRDCSGLTSVTIPNSVTSIGSSAFRDCSGLTSITIPNSVTSIGEDAFWGCSGLTSITIPNSVTSIDCYAFEGCSGLTSITIPNSVTSIGNSAFDNCSGLTSVTIPNSVTTIGDNAFRGCSGLASITIPNSVTSIGDYALSRCSGLTYITIPNSVTSIGEDAFWGCSGLTTVTLNSNAIVSKSYTGSSNIKNLFGNQVKEYILGNEVTSIGDYAFYGCSGLISVSIPKSVTSIGIRAFEGCSGLTAVNITDLASWCNISFGDNTYIHGVAEYSNPLSYAHHLYLNGEEVKDLVIPNSVTSIDRRAFYGCENLTSVTIPNSVTSIGNGAFYDCSGLTSVTIPNSVTSIGEDAFSYCSGLTSITIPNSVTSIGNYAFSGCSGLTAVTIPNSVTSIGEDAFWGCSGLTTVTLNSNDIVSKSYTGSSNIKDLFGNQVKEYILGNEVTSIGDYAFSGCSGLTSITIPNSVTSIGYEAFSNCSGLTAVTIPNGVTSIGDNAFSWCRGLTSITIPNSVTSIGNGAFSDCSGLTSVTIPNSVTSIGEDAFSNCTGLIAVTLNNNAIVSKSYTGSSNIKNLFGNQVKEYILGNEVTSIGDYAFSGCSGLTSITIPNSVTSIGYEAFNGCSGLTSITIPQNVAYIGSDAFKDIPTIYVERGGLSLLGLWGNKYVPYEKTTKEKLTPPYIEVVDKTQTTVTFELKNSYPEYTYQRDNNNPIDKDTKYVLKGLRPDYGGDASLYALYKDKAYSINSTSYSTEPISPSISRIATASSLALKGTYTEGDAVVTGQRFEINNAIYEGDEAFVSGLNPNTEYNVTYYVDVEYGDYNQTYKYQTNQKISTLTLTLTTLQPKVISSGNVIVAAESNLNDEETNVGFEWRRTDWDNTFASQTGSAVLFDGQMEGYIRNMNADKLWKYRAYYLSNSGTYYYGDWVGLDPSNTSYFEPTVHTYAKISVEGNGALVKGYAMRGTDKVKVQGFKYWKTVAGANLRETAQRRSAAVPGDAMTEEVAISGAGQQMMSANLKGLDYNSTYHFVAFVTTEENETFYGEEQSFTTGEDPTGIESVEADGKANEPVREVARYNLNGQRITAPQKGVNIIRYSNGQTKKVFIK